MLEKPTDIKTYTGFLLYCPTHNYHCGIMLYYCRDAKLYGISATTFQGWFEPSYRVGWNSLPITLQQVQCMLGEEMHKKAEDLLQRDAQSYRTTKL